MDVYYAFSDSYFDTVEDSRPNRNYYDNTKKKVYSSDKKQYIKENLESGRLKYSGNFYLENNTWIKIHSSGILFTSKYNYVAIVKLIDEETLDFNEPFENIKRIFFNKLVITEVLKDELKNTLTDDYNELIHFLKTESKKSVENLEWAENLFQLSIILEKFKCMNKKFIYLNSAVLHKIIDNGYISIEFKNIAKRLLNTEELWLDRSKYFLNNKKQFNLNLTDKLQVICKNAVQNHKKILLDCQLKMLPDKLIFCIQNQDITLFMDLIGTLNDELFHNFVNCLKDDLFKKVSNRKNYKSLKKIAPLTNPIYYFLAKGLQELIIEISKKENKNPNDLLTNKQGKLNIKNLLTEPNCILRQQCEIIFKIMKHFQPGHYSFKQKLNYKFNLLENLNYRTDFQRMLDWTGYTDVDSNNINIPQERLVWLCIFDHVISKHIEKKDLVLFTSLIKDYIDFVQFTKTDLHESFRIVTHNIINFIVQLKIDSPTIPSTLKFIPFAKFINQHFKDEQFMSNDFRDCIDMSNEYLKIKNLIINLPDKDAFDGFRSDMEEIREKLLKLTDFEITDSITLQISMDYFKCFNEFFIDFNVMPFDWFVKNNSDLDFYDHLIKEKIVKIVDNKLATEVKKTYLVLNNKKFINILNAYEKVVPRHYLIDIIKILSSQLSDIFVKKSWNNDQPLSQTQQLNATKELLSAIRNSFLYFKEQPGYVSFDQFKRENTEPFISAIQTSSCYEDFVKRINVIKESFWYMRKQEEIDVEEALKLFQAINDKVNIKILEEYYNNYLEKFNYYIYETFDKNYDDKIKFIVNQVHEQHEAVDFRKWDSEFKSKVIPSLLAGLAAVWSIQKSKDIANSGKILKPHCIQILCVLRLLSADKETIGVDKHLIQVLTGQGKSLILGLLSSLLALTDHRVHIICYSEYLVNRDQSDFYNFYKEFGIHDNIIYDTFDGMCSKIIDNEEASIETLVIDQILNLDTKLTKEITQEDISNTILLIDEVDVFFSDLYYGNTYNPVSQIKMPAFVEIQEEIWKLVQIDNENTDIQDTINNYIDDEINKGNEAFLEFHRFRSKPHTYNILRDGENILKTQCTNQFLWNEHLDLMINNAKTISRENEHSWLIIDFKIINDIIHRKDENDIYVKNYFYSYYNIFNYLKLKKKDFDHKNYQNYGYMSIGCGSISYAKLPENYPLILGVSGTLTTLNDCEKKAIVEHYNINHISKMPSFFGYSNLEFDPNTHFLRCDSEEKWLDQIFYHANSMIEVGRSVLTFFKTDKEMIKFKTKFYNKFNRLNVLTGNSENQNFIITQAGVVKTLTLVTREMGRGVDFNSSVSVEKNGGMHVIQTFFSLDVKEETQIRGRTARKDNKGSFEIIVCNEHLIEDELMNINQSSVDYQSLNEKRTIKMMEKGEQNSTKIRNSELNHRITMNYYRELLTLKSS